MNRKSLVAIVAGILAAVVVVIALGAQTIRTSAENNTADMQKCYYSYEIQPDDTLWSISQQKSEEYGCSVREYMKELKEVNGLKSDRIYAGAHLIVIYWE